MCKHIQAVIFDLDGVLVNTDEMHFRAWNKIARELNIPFDNKKNKLFRGVSRMQCLELLIGDRVFSSSEKIELAERKNQFYLAELENLSCRNLLPGVERLLNQLTQKKITIALASSSKNAKTVICKLSIERYFTTVVDGNNDFNMKPAPDIFLKCADLLRFLPKYCMVVEDSQAGVDAAKKARMFVVGISQNDKLQRADKLFTKTSEIINLF